MIFHGVTLLLVTLPGIHKPEHDGNDEWEYLLIIQSPFALANDMPNTLMVFNDVFVRGLFATIGTLTGDSKPPQNTTKKYQR